MGNLIVFSISQRTYPQQVEEEEDSEYGDEVVCDVAHGDCEVAAAVLRGDRSSGAAASAGGNGIPQ